MVLLSHKIWKSDLIGGLASFSNAVLLNLSKSQPLKCFEQRFKSFGDRNWVSKDLRSTSKDCYVEFVDDLRYVYVENMSEVEDITTFLSCCPALRRRVHTQKLFEKCRLCLTHSTINVPYVGLGSASRNVVALDLLRAIRPLQFYLLSVNQDSSFLSRGESVDHFCELLESFDGTALLPIYDP